MAIAKSRTNPVSHVEFPALDGLRALAVTAVFIYHAALGSKTLTEHAADVVVHFDTGVQIFFVLSGFLIYRPFAAAHLAGRRVGMVQSYARRRAMRIYPAYWLALGVLLLIGTVTVANGWMLLANLTLTQTYFERFPQGLPQAWSLVVEVSFYVFVPLFAVLVRAVGARVGAWRAEIGGALMCIALGYLAVWAQTLEPPLALQVLPPALATLGAGMLLAVLTLSAPHAPRLVPTLQRWAQRVWPWWIGAGLFFGWQVARRYGYFDLTRQQHMGDDMLRVPVALLLVAPFVLAPAAGGLARAGLRLRPVVWVGVVSYGVYLWHIAVLQEWEKPIIDAIGGVGIIVLYGVSVAIASISWLFLERPLLARSHRGRPAAGPSLEPEQQSGGG